MTFCTKQFLSLLLIFVITAGVLTGCGQDKTHSIQETIKIGANIPLSGDLAFIGEPLKDGMELALKDLSDQKSVQIYYEDNQSNPQSGVLANNNLISNKEADLIVSSPTFISRAIQPSVHNNQKTHFIFSFDPVMSQEYTSVCAPTISSLATYIKTKELVEKEDIKKVAILYFGSSEHIFAVEDKLSPYFDENNIEKLLLRYNLAETDFATYITRVKDFSPDLFLVIAFANNYPRIMKDIETQQIDKENILFDLNILDAPIVIDTKILASTRFIAPKSMVCKTQAMKDFDEKFKKLYNKEPHWFSYYAYDLIKLLSQHRQNIKTGNLIELLSDSDYQTMVSGIKGFDEFCQAKIDYVISQVSSDGELVCLE